MKREIKFRAWDKETIKMIYGGGFFQDNSTNNENWFFGIIVPHPDNCEIMQYTGLKDKNGVEIYEGDIVLAQDGVWSVFVRDLEDGVTLDNDFTEESSMQFIDGEYSLRETEVIGNVYQNPELLKEL